MDFVFDIYSYLFNKMIDFRYWLNPDAYHAGARRGAFLVDELRIRDYSYWDGKRFYTSHQAACLIHGFTPGYERTSYPQYVQDTEKHLIASVFDRSLDTTCLPRDILDDQRTHKFFARSLTFLLGELGTYCQQEGIESAFINRGLRKEKNSAKVALAEAEAELAKVRAELGKINENTRIECLGESHAYYSRELDTAVNAWLGLFEAGGFNEKLRAGGKKKIDDWLISNHPELSTEARKRVTQVINPDKFKKGGAPKQ